MCGKNYRIKLNPRRNIPTMSGVINDLENSFLLSIDRFYPVVTDPGFFLLPVPAAYNSPASSRRATATDVHACLLLSDPFLPTRSSQMFTHLAKRLFMGTSIIGLFVISFSTKLLNLERLGWRSTLFTFLIVESMPFKNNKF